MRALMLGVVLAAAVGACIKDPKPHTPPEHDTMRNEITALWAQIRDWRREAKMDLDPPAPMLIQLEGRTVSEAARACAEHHDEPKECHDVCNLANAICDNAEAICDLADKLGKDDRYAQGKCTSAKASCREAKQRCCGCSMGDPKSPKVIDAR